MKSLLKTGTFAIFGMLFALSANVRADYCSDNEAEVRAAALAAQNSVMEEFKLGVATKGAGWGLGCVVFSAAVLGMDGGALTATCLTVTAGGTAGHYSADRDKALNRAHQAYIDVYEKMRDPKCT